MSLLCFSSNEAFCSSPGFRSDVLSKKIEYM